VGDVKALVGAVNLGAARLAELHDRLVRESGLPLAAVTADLLDYAERRTRQAIARLPRGACSGAGHVDDDGVVPGHSYTVRVRVEAVDDVLTVDFDGTDPQATGPINASRSQAESAAIYGVRMFLDIPDVPLNEGSFRPVRMRFPERTVVNPAWPAPVSGRAATMMAVVEAMFEALAAQQPDRAVAESSINHVIGIASVEADTGRSRTISLNEYGGVGARSSMDGVDAHGAALFGGRSFTVPVEALEQEHPVRCRSFKLRIDSGGPGRWRGGLGVERTLEVLEDLSVSMRADKQVIPPRGREGGLDGAGAAWVLERADGTVEHLRSKETNIRLQRGDRITMLSAGGGGFGPPDERPAALVEADVAARKVSPEAARSLYHHTGTD
jgi:N-methylhydantoinase B